MTRQPTKEDLISWGYAPGNYSCVCRTCNEEHEADKRAWRCKACATRCFDEAQNTPPEPVISIGASTTNSDLAQAIRDLSTRHTGLWSRDEEDALDEVSTRLNELGDDDGRTGVDKEES